MLPVVAVQVIVNVAGVVWFAVTETVCGLGPLTVQLDGIGLSPTEWLPTLRLLNVTLLLAPTCWLEPASTVTVYPDGGFGPLVAVVTVRHPVEGAAHVTVNAVDPPLPATTFTVRGFAPLTVQFAATPERATLGLPAGRLVKVTLPLVVAIGWLAPWSTVTV